MSFGMEEGLDATGLAALVRAKEVSPLELLEAAVARIDRLNPALNAVAHRFEEYGRALIARGLPEGPFTGVPFLLKGTGAALAGQEQSVGSGLFRGAVAGGDSTLALRHQAAGLVPIGRTNVPEFALSFTTEPEAFGATRNPWDVGRSPGGSSGGSAAAVASGMVTMAHASDGAGSTRLPAGHCGLFGFKPTRMRNPAGPEVAEGVAGMGTPHAVTWSVRDSARLLDATSGADVGDPYAAPGEEGGFAAALEGPPGRLRIGVMLGAPLGEAIDPACVAAAREAAALCESLGHDVEEAVLEHEAEGLRQAWRVIAGVNLVPQIEGRAKRLGLGVNEALGMVEAVNAAWYEEGRRCAGTAYLSAIGQLHRVSRAMGRFFARYDVVLTPLAAEPAPVLGRLAGQGLDLDTFYGRFWEHSPFTAMFNASGCPAMSVPLAVSGGGLPIGVHFGAGFGRDGVLFGLAGQLEAAAPWAGRRPPISVSGR